MARQTILSAMTKATESITVRGLEAGTKQKLRVLAAVQGRSMEEQVRSILRDALVGHPGMKPKSDQVDLGTAIRRRFAKYGGVDLPLPLRGPDREPPDFSE
jgi:plasmid stability protein